MSIGWFEFVETRSSRRAQVLNHLESDALGDQNEDILASERVFGTIFEGEKEEEFCR